MSIFVSALSFNPHVPPPNLSSNLYSDIDAEELHVFAEVLSLPRHRFVPGVIPHYVIEAYQRTNALSYNAQELTKSMYAYLYERYKPAGKLTRQYLIRKYRVRGALKKIIYSRVFSPDELAGLEQQLINNSFKDIKKAIDKARKTCYNDSERQLNLSGGTEP